MDLQQALALFRDGRTDEAARAYEEALRDDPGNAAALIQLGSLRLVQGDVTAAEVLLRRAADASPDLAEAQANLAAALQRQDRFDEAITRYERALSLDPGLVDARFAFAVCLQTAGRTEQALACYEALLQVRPDHAEANYGLGMLLAEQGRLVEAIGLFRTAVAADPQFAEAHYQWGRLLALGQGAGRAVSRFHRALAIDPDYTEARLALADTLARLDVKEQAMVAYQAVLAAEPNNEQARRGIETLRDRLSRQQSAEFGEPLNADAGPHAEIAKVEALRSANRHDAALEAARRLVEQHPESADCLSLRATILSEMGAIDEALADFRGALALAPERPGRAYHIVQLTKVQPDEEVLPVLEAALANLTSLPVDQQYLVHFSLAKAYSDLGALDRGFDHLLQGNAIFRSQIDYDETVVLGRMRRTRLVFSAEMMARQGAGARSSVPVFVLGMPGSGTTLVERILAAHSAVFGGGAQRALGEEMTRGAAVQVGGSAFPDAVWTMTDAAFRRMGARYVARLRRLAPGMARITDSMPDNFVFIGLIRLILPNARIIHVRRDPIDTCLSCFARQFTKAPAFTFDLAELGRFYREYQLLMAHWRAVLPESAMLEVDYKTLLDDPETQARRIVAYCGLDWEPTCLQAAAASLAQGGQPVCRGKSRAWRPDPAVLRPLLMGLEGLSRSADGSPVQRDVRISATFARFEWSYAGGL